MAQFSLRHPVHSRSDLNIDPNDQADQLRRSLNPLPSHQPSTDRQKKKVWIKPQLFDLSTSALPLIHRLPATR